LGTSDLHPVHPQNRLSKYADDSYLFIGSNHLATATDELQHFTNWSKEKNLRINSAKTREMVIVRRNKCSLSTQPSISGVPRTTSIKALGVIIGEKLTITDHINKILCSGSASLYAIRTLKAHGASVKELQTITRATTISRMMYASPAWWGLASSRDKTRLEGFMNRLRRAGYLKPDDLTAETLAQAADEALFCAVQNNELHVLRGLCPVQREPLYNFRQRAHSFTLPDKDSVNFIPRMLYKNMY